MTNEYLFCYRNPEGTHQKFTDYKTQKNWGSSSTEKKNARSCVQMPILFYEFCRKSSSKGTWNWYLHIQSSNTDSIQIQRRVA